jgi:hypothetical protein
METQTLIDERIGDLVLHARGLEAVRDLLARRGATPEELDAHTRELERVRRRLAAKFL